MRSLILLILLCCAAPGLTRHADEPKDVSSQLEAIRAQHNLPALAALAWKDDAVVAHGAAGLRKIGDDTPVTLDDRWHIGSCTKAMTAMLAGLLVEEGLLTWDSTIAEVFADDTDLLAAIDEGFHAVTLRHLLAHRAGLAEDRMPDPSVWMKIMGLQGDIRTQRREAIALVFAQPPVTPPGTAMAYSNYGYVAAAAMMERVADASWEDLMRTRLFQPLGITSAAFGPPGIEGDRAAAPTQPWGHRDNDGSLVALEPRLRFSDNPEVLGPAGRVHITLEDWAKFADVVMAGARGEDAGGLTAATWKELLSDAFDQDYALGWGLGDRPWADGPILTHAGSNRLWFAVIWLAPKKDLALLAVTNAGGDAAAVAVDEAVGAVLNVGLQEP